MKSSRKRRRDRSGGWRSALAGGAVVAVVLGLRRAWRRPPVDQGPGPVELLDPIDVPEPPAPEVPARPPVVTEEPPPPVSEALPPVVTEEPPPAVTEAPPPGETYTPPVAAPERPAPLEPPAGLETLDDLDLDEAPADLGEIEGYEEIEVYEEFEDAKPRWAWLVWLMVAALVTAAIVTIASAEPEERGRAQLGDLDRMGCVGARKWLSTLDLGVRMELLAFDDGFFIFGSAGEVAYLTPSPLFSDVSEVYEVRPDRLESTGSVATGSNWPKGVSVATAGQNFSCSRGPSVAGDCFVHERLLASVPPPVRRKLYRDFDRVSVSLFGREKGRVVAYSGEESTSYLLSSGDLRRETDVAAAHVYAAGPSLDIETADGRPGSRSC